jgi:hypothetical protein
MSAIEPSAEMQIGCHSMTELIQYNLNCPDPVGAFSSPRKEEEARARFVEARTMCDGLRCANKSCYSPYIAAADNAQLCGWLRGRRGDRSDRLAD